MVADAQVDEAEKMLLFGPPYPGVGFRLEGEESFSQWQQSELKAKPRTLTDVVLARQRFTIASIHGYELFVEKDKVALENMALTYLGVVFSHEDLRGIDLNLTRRANFLRKEP